MISDHIIISHIRKLLMSATAGVRAAGRVGDHDASNLCASVGHDLRSVTDRWLGYEPEELVGMPRTVFVHPDDEQSLRQKADDLVADRANRISSINRIRHKEGWWIWIEASVKLMRDAEG